MRHRRFHLDGLLPFQSQSILINNANCPVVMPSHHERQQIVILFLSGRLFAHVQRQLKWKRHNRTQTISMFCRVRHTMVAREWGWWVAWYDVRMNISCHARSPGIKLISSTNESIGKSNQFTWKIKQNYLSIDQFREINCIRAIWRRRRRHRDDKMSFRYLRIRLHGHPFTLAITSRHVTVFFSFISLQEVYRCSSAVTTYKCKQRIISFRKHRRYGKRTITNIYISRLPSSSSSPSSF